VYKSSNIMRCSCSSLISQKC